MSKCSDSITLCKVSDGARGLQGLQGPQGEQGVPGKDGTNGTNGKTSYFHIKYSSVASPTLSSQMTETPSEYIGTYVDFTEDDSTDPSKYKWARFEGLQGEKGDKGIPGTDGTNGKTSYLHIKYSNDGGATFTTNNGEVVGDYIGVCTDFNPDDPTTVSSYKWSKTKGDTGATGSPGKDGTNGKDGKDGTSVTIVSQTKKYRNDSQGDTVPSGGTWTDSPNPVKGMYLWCLITTSYSDGRTDVLPVVSYVGTDGAKGDKGETGATGPQGPQGEQGEKGDTGATGPQGPKGDPGKDGTNGTNGKDGKTGQYTAFQYYASTSDTAQQGGAWSDTMPSISGGKYLWMRTQVVPAGGSISSSSWGTPVLAGTDISKLMTTIETTNSQVVELGDKVTQNTTAINANSTAIATKVNQTVYDDKISSIESTIEQTANKIALTVETVNGEKVVKYNGIVISEKDGEGNILIRADKILLDGSVTADKLDVKTLNTVYLTINGTLDNDVLSTIDKNEAGEAISIGSVDDTNKYYLASQLKIKIKSISSNTMSLFSKLGNFSNVRVINNTDNSFFTEDHFEYYKRFSALPFITNSINASGSIYYWPTNQYFSFANLEENPIRTSTDGYNWGYGTNSWASNQKNLFGRFAISRNETEPTLHCVCYETGTTNPIRLMSTTDGYNFYNQDTIARTSVDDSFFLYSSFNSYPVLVTEKHTYFIAPSGITFLTANSEISVQVSSPLASQSFHEITLPITPEKVFSGILLKNNSILCCVLQYNSTKYFYFKKSSSWISFAVPDNIKNKNFSEANYYEIGDYLYIVAYKYVGKLNLTTLTSSSTIETMFSGNYYGVVPISNKYIVILEYDPNLKTYSRSLFSETRKLGGLPANSSLVSSAFFYKSFPQPYGNICYIDDNTTVILSGTSSYPSLKVSMTEETYSTDVLAFENATDNYLGTLDSFFPNTPTDKQAISTDLQLNLPSAIPSDMDTYRRIPTLFTQTAVYLSLASASVESYTRFDTSTNQDVVVPAYNGKPSKVTTSPQSLRINDTEYANSSWFVKNKTALAITFTPNATAKGVYTGDLNPKEVDGEEASARDIGNITPYDTITGREITANEKLITGNIEAKTTSANIGSPNQKFNNVYAKTLNADEFSFSSKIASRKSLAYYDPAGGSVGYVKAITLTVIGSYPNSCITWAVTQRHSASYYIDLFLSNRNDNLAGIDYFGIRQKFQNSSSLVYAVVSGSTVDIYIKKIETWDGFNIIYCEFPDGYLGSRVQIEYPDNQFVTSLPSGAVQASCPAYITESGLYGAVFN